MTLRPLMAAAAVALAGTPVPAADPPGWTFDEAAARLAASPRDPYLQYVVLQLGRREGRLQQAAQLLDRPSPLPLFEDRGRRGRTDLFGLFTGALAVQESLQLDTMRGDGGGPGRRAADPAAPAAPPPPPRPPVAVGTLAGPTVPSHPWEKLLGGRTPDVGPLAGCVPDDFYLAEFRSVAKLNEALDLARLWGGHVFAQALGGDRSAVAADRIRRRLGLRGVPAEAVDALGVTAVAVTGSDLFLAEGSDVTVLVRGGNVGAAARLFAGPGTAPAGEHAGVPVSRRTDPAAGTDVFAADPRPDLHVRSTSLPALRRVLEAVAGTGPAKRLGESAEFRYVRTLMPRGAAEEDGFVYLSDAFIRNLVGPQQKLAERRRMLVYNHLRMIGHAALLFRTEHGRPPASLDELADAKCAPGVFGRGELAHPDGGGYSLAADGMSGVCSKWGRADDLVPLLERPLTVVTADEADEYRRFVAEYSQYWRTFFDPIAVRVRSGPAEHRLETLVLPLIDNSLYTSLARATGKPAPLDVLPTPKREIGGVWLRYDKKPLLDALGPEPEPEAEAKAPAAPPPPGGVAEAVRRAGVQNDLKQLALALHNYHDANGQFPPAALRSKAGKPLLSWRVAILPYVGQADLYKRFNLDEPWDGPTNKPLLAKMPAVFAGPAGGKRKDGHTAYLAPVGPRTVFPANGEKVGMAGIPDGTSNTVLLVEAADDRAVEWTRPDDHPVDPKEPVKGLAAGRPGFHVAMADGSVRYVPAGVNPVALARAFDRADGFVPLDLDEPPARPAGPRGPATAAHDLERIGLAMHNYEAANGHLPTGNVRDKAGKPLLSWRVALLPFLDQNELYERFKLDEPWDSPANKPLLAKMPAVYGGLSDAKLVAAGKTTILLPAGPGTVSPPDGRRLRIAGITDGTSNTVLAVLAADARAVEWTKPEDLPFDPKNPFAGVARPGEAFVPVLMADGSIKQLAAALDPKKAAALMTVAGGEAADLTPADEAPPPGGQGPGDALFPLADFRLTPADAAALEAAGYDLAALRRLLRDGLGDQIGVQIHDAPRLLDSEIVGTVTGDGGAGLSGPAAGGIGLAVQVLFGPSSLSVPVKDAKAVDDFLAAVDRALLARRGDLTGFGLGWNREAEFYRFPLAGGHTVRCLAVRLFGLKWRTYWARIGTGLYVTNRPFILEDIAAAHAAAGAAPSRPAERGHVLLRVRPENWSAVLPGYNLGWAEGHRAGCHDKLSLVASVARGWNDPSPAVRLERVRRVYGTRPACPDGGEYAVSTDGRSCRCSVHGGADDPRQPAAPAADSGTGRLLRSFAGLTAVIRFEDDGLRVVVTVQRR
jgi:hypothetical protein